MRLRRSAASVSNGARDAGSARESRDAEFLRQSAIARLIQPDEVAGIVAFLCSDTAAYINGASIHVDGGWTAR